MGASSYTQMNILEFKDVSFSYSEKQVLQNVSFNIKQGSFFVLLGLNGAGKSTIFSLITRLLKVKDGDIKIDTNSIKKSASSLKDVGIVFQEPTLDLDLTVRQNLYYYGALKGLNFKETIASVKDEIDRLELNEVLETNARDLNGGHRRRVEIVRSLINKPKLLLLDEATVGLDLKSRFDILEYVRTLVKEKNISVLWITHLFDEIKDEDDISFIKKGEIVEEGIVKDIIAKHRKKDLVETFNHLVR